MADSIVRLKVEDDSFNAKIKEAARSFADFGKRVASAGVEAMGDFAKGVKTAKAAFEGFNAALKANALVLVASLAIQAASALGEMIGNWITGADDAADAQKNLNDQLEETKRLVESITNEGDFNARIARAQGKSTSEILQIKVDAARQANNVALARLMDNNLKPGTKEYEDADKLYQQANKRLQKAIQDQKVDEIARQYKTGEYASKGGGGGGRSSRKKEVTYAADSVAAQQAEVQRLTKLWNEAGADVRDQYLQPIIESEAKLKQMREDFELAKQQASLKDSIAFPTEQAANDPAIVKKSDSWRDIVDIPAFEGFTSPLTELENHLQELIELQNTFGRVSAEAWQGYQQQINETNQKINEFKGNGLDKDGKKIKSSWGDAASAISGVGSALNSIEDPTAKILGIVAQAIAGVAAGAGQAVSAKDTTSSGWAWIGAAAAITASMVAMISQIHSATGYAQGGVIQGNHYSGDMEIARVNAGETILTRAQSGVIASQLEGGGMRNLQLSATIKGEDIRLVLNNNGRRTGRGEYVTTNFT